MDIIKICLFIGPNGYGKTCFAEKFSQVTGITHIEGDRFKHPTTGKYMNAIAVQKLKKYRNNTTCVAVLKASLSRSDKTVIVSSMSGVLQALDIWRNIAHYEFGHDIRLFIVCPSEIYQRVRVNPTTLMDDTEFSHLIDKWTNGFNSLVKSRRGRGMIICPGKENVKSFRNMTMYNLNINLPELIRLYSHHAGISSSNYIEKYMTYMSPSLVSFDHTDKTYYSSRLTEFGIDIPRLCEWLNIV
jgi:adenylate kinase family enzyme